MSISDIPRGLDRAVFARLMAGDWVKSHQNVLICGPTGVGKTFLACALAANQACRQETASSMSACYLRWRSVVLAATPRPWARWQRPRSCSSMTGDRRR